VSLARRNLFQEKPRFALSIAGVALAVMLILILSGFLSGMFAQIAAYLDHAPGTVVLAQDGVTSSARLLYSPGASGRLRQRAKVVPILSQFVILDLHDKKQPAYLVGYDSTLGGGPWRMAEGNEPRKDDQVVVDRILAERHGIVIGDKFDILDKEFTVVGLSEGTASWMTSFLFIRKTAAESLLRAPDATSFLLLTPSERFSPEELRARLKDVPGAEALLKRDMIANDAKLFGRIFSAPLQLMVAIAFLVGTLVVGLVIYTATVERQREYGVLKAVGAGNGMLYRVVAIQALIVTSLALGSGGTGRWRSRLIATLRLNSDRARACGDHACAGALDGDARRALPARASLQG
jgi:putative ABC transport system permease protein